MTRMRIRAAWWLIPAVLLVSSVGCTGRRAGTASGAASTGAAESGTLRVASYNIAAGNGDLTAISQAIRDLRADIVALQEVDVHWSERSGFRDQAEELGDALGLNVVFAPIYSNEPLEPGAPRREFGVALLSRHDIIAFDNRQMSRLSTQSPQAAPSLMSGLLDAVIRVHGHSVRVLNVHLDYRADPGVRARQVAELVESLASDASPTLLFGDLNAPPAAPELAPLFRMLRDSWTGTDPGFTYPATAPARRIDYVLHSSHFRVRSASVGNHSASDHRPVVVELLLAPL